MALSDSVTESLNEAEANLRNALSFAARGEKAVVCSAISKIILEIESIKAYNTMSTKYEGQDDNPFKNFGGLL